MENFIFGFHAVARILVTFGGGLSALLLFALAVALILGIAGMIFDRVTHAIAGYWIHCGKCPTSKFARILLEHHGSVQS